MKIKWHNCCVHYLLYYKCRFFFSLSVLLNPAHRFTKFFQTLNQIDKTWTDSLMKLLKGDFDLLSAQISCSLVSTNSIEKRKKSLTHWIWIKWSIWYQFMPPSRWWWHWGIFFFLSCYGFKLFYFFFQIHVWVA